MEEHCGQQQCGSCGTTDILNRWVVANEQYFQVCDWCASVDPLFRAGWRRCAHVATAHESQTAAQWETLWTKNYVQNHLEALSDSSDEVVDPSDDDEGEFGSNDMYDDRDVYYSKLSSLMMDQEMTYSDDDQDTTDFTHVNKERWIRNMRVKRREQRKRAALKSRTGSSGCGGVKSPTQTDDWCNCSTYCYNCPAPGRMKLGNKGTKRDRKSTGGHCNHMKPRLNNRLENSRQIKHDLHHI